jgi:ubiquinone/menaquinone biosynthesis C-methylase UbiE
VNTSEDGEHAAEAARVEHVYRRYARSHSRQRAWAADNPGNMALRAELLAAIRCSAAAELAGEHRILDAGCGNGRWLEALQREGVRSSRLVGVDVQQQRLDQARRHVSGAQLALADVRQLPFADDSFGLVLALTLLSSLDSADSVRRGLSELMRVTQPGGLVLCYEPRLPSPFNRNRRTLSDADLDAAGVQPRDERRLTLLPQLARRLGRSTPWSYPLLARLRPLRSHRLVGYRKPFGGALSGPS